MAPIFRRDKDAERSNGGDRIERRNAPTPFRVPQPVPASREALVAHLEEHLGPMAGVWSEVLSNEIRLDVYIWEPTERRPVYTFVTGGMSDRPMNAPTVAADGSIDRAELMICLPPTWPVPKVGSPSTTWRDDDSAYFPIRWLKYLARFPHEHDTWIWSGHTIPNGDPPLPLAASTALAGWLLMNPQTMPEGFECIKLGDDQRIFIFGLVALHADEMAYKLQHGLEGLFSRFEHIDLWEFLDVTRRSAVG